MKYEVLFFQFDCGLALAVEMFEDRQVGMGMGMGMECELNW